MHGRPWTKEEDKYVIRAYRRRVPVGDMARNLKRTSAAIKARAQKLKCNPNRRKRWTPEEDAELLGFLEAFTEKTGRSTSQISSRIRCLI